MNQRDTIIDLKAAKDLLDWRMVQNGKMNTLKPGANETVSHFLMKAYIGHSLVCRGLHFYAEAQFRNNAGRADLFCLEKRAAIEVLESEVELKAHKRENYPCPIITVRASAYSSADEAIKWLEELP